MKMTKEFATLLTRIENNDPSLTTVYLGSKQIGDTGAQAFAAALEKNQTVTTVNLRGNQIGATGAQAFATALEKNQTVTTVDLSDNQIGATGARALATALEKNRTVTTVNLRGNQIGDTGARAFATALEKNQTVTTVDLGWNQIGDTGAQAFAAALEKNQTVTTVNLRGNQIGATGAQALATALEKNQTVTGVDLKSDQIRAEMRRTINSLLARNQAIFEESQKATAASAPAISGSSSTKAQTPSETEFATPLQDSPKTKIALKSEFENADLVAQQVLHQDSVSPAATENKSYQIIGEHKTETEIEKTILKIIQDAASRVDMNLEQLKWAISLAKDKGGIRHLGPDDLAASPASNFEGGFASQAKIFSRNFQTECKSNGIVSINSENVGMRLHKLPENIIKKLDDLEVDDRGYIKKIEAQETNSSATLQPSTILEPQAEPHSEPQEQPNLRQKPDLKTPLENIPSREREFVTPSQASSKTKVTIKSEAKNGDLDVRQVLNQTQTQTPQISLAEFQSHQAQTAALAQSLQSTQALEQKFTQQLAAIQQDYSMAAQRLERIDAEQIRISQLPVAQVSTDNLTVDPKFKLSPEAIAEKLHIANNPSLKSYRDKVEKTFNEVFLTAAMTSVGEFTSKSSTPAEMIRTFSNFSSGLPFAPIILSCAAAATDGVLQARKEGRLLNVAELNPTSNTMDAAFFSEEIARRFTITNEAKINSLAQGKNTQELRGISGFLESAKKFAQDQMTNLDPATARGLFGEVQSPVQLLAYKDSQAAVEYVLNGELKNKSGTNVMVAEIVEAVTGMRAKSLVPAIPVVAVVVDNETNQGKQSGQLKKSMTAQKTNAPYQLPVKKLPVAKALPTPPAPNPIVKGASNLHSGDEIERRFNEMREFHAQQIANLSQSNSQKMSQMQEQNEKQLRDFQKEAARRDSEHKREIEELRVTSSNSEKRSLAADRKAEQAEKRSLAAKLEAAQAVKKMNSIIQSKFVGEGDQVQEIFTTNKDVTIRVVNPEMEERMALIIQQQDLDREENRGYYDRQDRTESQVEKLHKRNADKKKNSLSGRISSMLK